jgi:nucleotide-binding universal stress UspA family protein
VLHRYQRIVAAFDGTDASEEAFAAMMPLVRMDQPEVAVLYVTPSPRASTVPPPRLAEACARLREEGVDAHLTLREGEPASAILAYLQQRRPDLLVMETEGRSGIRRLAQRSVAEEVLHHSEVPVLLVRPGGSRKSWSKMMVALDGSPRAEEILEDVVPLARRLHASVELVRVALPPITGLSVGDVPGVVVHDDPEPYLREVKARLVEEDVEVRIAAPQGRAASALLERAKDSDASLICLSTQGRTGFERVLLGSTAEEVIRRASCPVLVCRSVRVDGIPMAGGKAGQEKPGP